MRFRLALGTLGAHPREDWPVELNPSVCSVESILSTEESKDSESSLRDTAPLDFALWDPQGEVEGQLQVLLSLRETSPTLPIVLFLQNHKVVEEHLSLLVSSFAFDAAIAVGASLEEWNHLRVKMQQLRHTRSERLQLKTHYQKENFHLEHASQDLEKLVEERTAHLKASQDSLKKKMGQLRNLLYFTKELTSAITVEDVLVLLKREIRKFSTIRALYLCYRDEQNVLRLGYYDGVQIMEKQLKKPWPHTHRLRKGVAEDSKCLADVVGRPVAQVMSIPLTMRWSEGLEQGVPRAILFVENDLSDSESSRLVDFLQPRLQPTAVAIEKILLEQSLIAASLAWERTFNGLRDSVAIVDEEGLLLRSNSSYKALQKVSDYEALFSEKIRPLLDQGMQKRERVEIKVSLGSKIFDCRCYPILLHNRDLPTTAILHFVDVTLAHNYQMQIMQNEKMAAIGHLAGNIAHELNNPLTGIRSLAQVILNEEGVEEQVQKDLREVERASERCQLIINNLLEFSQGSVSRKLQVVCLNEIVEKTIPFLKTAMRYLNQDVELSSEPLPVEVEAQLMQQVVFNLVNNACQATPEGGWVKLRTSFKTMNGKSYAQLLVEDSGKGIPAENLSKIFEPFFTTKEQTEGTGLGLSMSKKIVEEFSGQVEVFSEEGVGSQFQLLLPIHQETNKL